MTTFCNTSDFFFVYSIYRETLRGVEDFPFIHSIQCNLQKECLVPDFLDVDFVCPGGTTCLDLCYLHASHNLTLYLILLFLIILILSGIVFYLDRLLHKKIKY